MKTSRKIFTALLIVLFLFLSFFIRRVRLMTVATTLYLDKIIALPP